MEDYDQSEDGLEQERIQKKALVDSLLSKRDEAVRARAASGIEQSWRDWERMYDGYDRNYRPADMVDYADGTASQRDLKQVRRSRVDINITQSRTDAAVGRFADLILPTDDKNWGLKITPIPENEELKKDRRVAFQDGEVIRKGDKEATIADVAMERERLMKDKMKKMENLIHDQLTECKYNSELRKVIKSAAMMGTGVLRGPNTIKRTSRKWTKTENGYELLMVEDIRPFSECVDVWAVYPDPQCSDDIKKAAYVWEQDSILPKDLKDLIGVPGYDSDEIIKVLNEEPKRIETEYDKKVERYKTYNTAVERGSAYQRWVYSGEVSRDGLDFLGCDCDEIGVKAASMSAVIVIVNDRVIKAELNILDSGELPYDFFKWSEISSSPWGVGIPGQLLHIQRIITNAWRAMMDNAGDSSGANYVFGSGIEPVDGKWELTGKKAWRVTNNTVDDVRKVFNQFQVSTNQGDLSNIIDMALRFSDLTTGIPTIFQGEAQKMPETLGATNIVVDSSNVSLRWRVKTWDDDVTDPHLTRYYDYNMQHHDDDSVKGDFQVDPIGARVLLERDSQAQTIVQLMSMKNDPDLGLIVDWEKAAKQLLATQRLDVLADDDEIEKRRNQIAEKPPESQPQVESAKIRTQADLQKAKIDAEAGIKEKQLQLQIQREEQKFEMAKLEREFARDMQIEKMKQDTAIVKLANDKDMTVEKIKADLAKSSATLNLQRELSGKDGRSPEVATPVVEPVGRASDGRAFQE